MSCAHRKKQLVDKIQNLILQQGGEVTELTTTKGGHTLMRWKLPDGRTGRVTFASTFGDLGRTAQNTLSMVRRMLR